MIDTTTDRLDEVRLWPARGFPGIPVAVLADGEIDGARKGDIVFEDAAGNVVGRSRLYRQAR